MFGCQEPPNMIILLRSNLWIKAHLYCMGKRHGIINTWLLYCYYTEAMQPKQIIEILSREYWLCIKFLFSTHFHRCMNQKRIIFNSIYIYLYRAFHNKYCSKVVFLLTYKRTNNLQRSVDVFRILFCPGFVFFMLVGNLWWANQISMHTNYL